MSNIVITQIYNTTLVVTTLSYTLINKGSLIALKELLEVVFVKPVIL